MKQSEFETLMMAHDNLQRELVEIKRLMGKDKHALIKSNISLNKKVQELEGESSKYEARINNLTFDLAVSRAQNKRYREALSIISANLPLDEREHYVDIARQALEGEE